MAIKIEKEESDNFDLELESFFRLGPKNIVDFMEFRQQQRTVTFRAPIGLILLLKSIAKAKGTKYQKLLRLAVAEYVEREQKILDD